MLAFFAPPVLEQIVKKKKGQQACNINNCFPSVTVYYCINIIFNDIESY